MEDLLPPWMTALGMAQRQGGSLGDILNMWLRRRSVARASAVVDVEF